MYASAATLKIRSALDHQKRALLQKPDISSINNHLIAQPLSFEVLPKPRCLIGPFWGTLVPEVLMGLLEQPPHCPTTLLCPLCPLCNTSRCARPQCPHVHVHIKK